MSSTPSAARIEVSGLTKRFGDVRAVDGLSFTIEPGSITGFLGPNGAGKTTTLRMLLGLVTPDAGQATIGGRRYADLPVPTSTVGAALEATGFHPARSARDHLRICCTISGYPQRRANEVLDMVGLSQAKHRAAGGYSLGMRQRLALAAALLGDPAVLILDEPANGLDPDGIAWLRRFLHDYARHDRSVLVSSHLLREMQQLVDHVVIAHRGRLVRQGSLESLSGHPAVFVRTPDGDELIEAVTRAEGARVEHTGPDTFNVRDMPVAELGRLALAAGVELHELTPQRDDLEHVFLKLTTEDDAVKG